MPRSVLAAVGVLALVATAGCAGVLGGEGTERAAYDVPERTATPTRTADDPGAPAELRPELESQARRLRAAGNYTVRTVRNTTGPDADVSLVNRTERVDLEGDRILVRNVYEFSRGYERARQTFYQNGTRIWDRLARGADDVEYRNWSSNRPGTAVEGSIDSLAGLGRALSAVELERDGSAWFDGEVMARYTAADPDDAVLSTRSAKHHDLTVLVDDDGVVRYVEERIVRDNAGRYIRTTRIEVVDVGSTTVRAPEWVDTEARATSGRTEGGNRTGATTEDR